MAYLSPFRALRPPPELAAAVAAPPYDVVDVDDARRLIAHRPDSFLRVTRPEADLPTGTDPFDPRVYAHGRATLDDFVRRGVLVRDPTPTLTVYRMTRGDIVQTGVVGCVSVREYTAGVIKKHENTRPDKEDDRVRHLDALDAHDEGVLLMSPPSAPLDAILADATTREPDCVVDDDDVEHALWVVSEPDVLSRVVDAFAGMRHLYVADGHHRCAAAARLRELRPGGAGAGTGAGVFPALVVSEDALQVLPYHRAVTDLGGQSAAGLLEALTASFEIVPSRAAVQPSRRGQVGMYTQGQWYDLLVHPGLVDRDDPVARLDVSVLHRLVLEPLLGVGDARTDPRLRFVGGADGVERLVKLVDSGECTVAFALYATSTHELRAVADLGLLMPPKSTWFDPKPRSGLFVHPIDPGERGFDGSQD